jgi:hypothetical protein
MDQFNVVYSRLKEIKPNVMREYENAIDIQYQRVAELSKINYKDDCIPSDLNIKVVDHVTHH